MIHLADICMLILTAWHFRQFAIAACQENCNTCDENVQCTSCKSGHFGLNIRCQHTCHSDCLNNECNAENGNCITCGAGRYGPQCQQNCSLCEDELCDRLNCKTACKSGYYEYHDSASTLCWKCPSDCNSCVNATVCSICNHGFYLYKIEYSGKINVKCLRCTHGSACPNYCVIQNCNKCQVQSNSLLCTECKKNYEFNGNICVPNVISCSQGCSTDCDKTGKCLGNCSVGWTGVNCSDSCASQCRECDKNNGNICEECKGDYYTETCTVSCNDACTKETGKQTCRLNDGYCFNGCENNFWGNSCNKNCPDGCAKDDDTNVCHRNNGTCTNGCVDGYTGDKCDTIVTTTESTTISEASSTKSQPQVSSNETTTVPDDEKTDTVTNRDDPNVIIIGAAAGGGGLVLIMIIIILIICVVKRRQKRDISYDKDNGVPNAIYEPECAPETSKEVATMPTGPMKPVTKQAGKEEIQDYIYTQPNTLNKGRRSLKEEQHSLYDHMDGEAVATKSVIIPYQKNKEENRNYINSQPNKLNTGKKPAKEEPHNLYDHIVSDLARGQTPAMKYDTKPNEDVTEGNHAYIYAQRNKLNKGNTPVEEEPHNLYNHIASDIDDGQAASMKYGTKPNKENKKENQAFIYAQPKKLNKGKRPIEEEPHNLYDHIGSDLDGGQAAAMKSVAKPKQVDKEKNQDNIYAQPEKLNKGMKIIKEEPNNLYDHINRF